MSAVDVIGTGAAILTTAAFVPQVWQIWRTRSAKDISLPMYLIFTAGLIGWLLYGVLLGAWPIIIANVITLALALAVIVMKVRWR
jgi:MtN3 and saliva related transmembrane protein